MTGFVQWIDETRADTVARILKPHVRGSTLDVGCWNGAVAKRLNLPDIVGIDVVQPANPQIEVRQFDGVHIPFENKTFDTVLCSTCLHHAEDPDALIEEVRRVGKRIVVFEDSCDTTVQKWSAQLLHAIGSRVVGMPYQIAGFRPEEAWRRFFEQHGLRVTQCSRHPGTQPLWLLMRHYLFILEAD